jgi:hypothetical protein
VSNIGESVDITVGNGGAAPVIVSVVPVIFPVKVLLALPRVNTQPGLPVVPEPAACILDASVYVAYPELVSNPCSTAPQLVVLSHACLASSIVIYVVLPSVVTGT